MKSTKHKTRSKPPLYFSLWRIFRIFCLRLFFPSSNSAIYFFFCQNFNSKQIREVRKKTRAEVHSALFKLGENKGYPSEVTGASFEDTQSDTQVFLLVSFSQSFFLKHPRKRQNFQLYVRKAAARQNSMLRNNRHQHFCGQSQEIIFLFLTWCLQMVVGKEAICPFFPKKQFECFCRKEQRLLPRVFPIAKMWHR